MLDLKGKWVLITGASRGLGRLAAKLMAEQGCNLILQSRSVDHTLSLEEEVKALGVKCHSFEADLNDIPSVMKMLSDIDALITPAEELPIVGKTEELLNGIQLYQSLTDVIRYIKDIGENREREAFRTETLNILRSMEMACGLIGIDEAPFNHDPSEDWEWMISLSEIFVSHRNHYLEHVSRL